MNNLKIAIFYDWINQWGGAERLLLDILKVFPQAQIFTTISDPNKSKWLKNKKVKVTFLNNFFKKTSTLLGILQPLAVENLDFSKFDIVISLTSQNGKALLTSPQTCHICYCLTPNRYLYQSNYPSFLKPIINIFKTNDYIYAQRPDFYLAISKTVQNRITTYYNRSSTVVYPGVDTNFFRSNQKVKSKNYYLVVSRLVGHKKIELAILACLKLKRKLVIVGTGRHLRKLKKISSNSPLITFVGQVGDKQLISYYQNCLALICPQLEDFGLTPLEVQACGKPVIAFNKGGIAETVINLKTGILFKKQNISSLLQAINIFEKTNIKSSDCIKNSIKFSNHLFMIDFKNQVQHLWRLHQSQNPAKIS